MKRDISNKHGMYELSHDMSNKLRLSILKNWETSEKSSNFTKL